VTCCTCIVVVIAGQLHVSHIQAQLTTYANHEQDCRPSTCTFTLFRLSTPCLAGAPVRLPVQDVFKGRQGGTCVSGKLEAGALRPVSKVLVVPGHVTATVKALEVNTLVRPAGDCVMGGGSNSGSGT
jgi:hypothetical protein